MRRPPPSGFVLMLVLVALLILTTLAMAYLIATRMRLRDPAGSTGQNFIQIPLDSVLSDIKGSLDADYPAKGAPGKRAPYDYPWTAATAAEMSYDLRQPAAGVPASGKTQGDPSRDDAWLASSSPDAAGRWPHLSNLVGAYLNAADADLTKPSNYPKGAPRIPTDGPSANRETDVAARTLLPAPAGDPRLVDVDGDGIGDALWFYPSVNRVNARRYVAAVYIEDLSAKLNANIALPLRTNGGYPAPNNGEPMGLSASDADLSAMAARNPEGAEFGLTDASLASLVAARIPATAPAYGPWSPAPALSPAYGPSATFDFRKRFRHFAERGLRADGLGAPLPGEDASAPRQGTRFGPSDETELRWSGGLDRLASTTRIEQILDLRSRGNLALRKQEEFYSDTGAASVDAFFRTNPRRWLTCFSGECLEQKGLDMNSGSSFGRYDANATAPSVPWNNAFPTVAERLFEGENQQAGDADDFPCSRFMQACEPDPKLRPRFLAEILHNGVTTARGQTHGHRANQPAITNQHAALAPLPVLTEVYAQRAMLAVTGVPLVGNTVETVAELAGKRTAWGYCFELSNPHACPVKLTGITCAFQVGGVEMVGAQPLDDLLDASWQDRDADGDCVLLPGDMLLVWKNGDHLIDIDLLPVVKSQVDAVGNFVAALVAASPLNAFNRPKVHALEAKTVMRPGDTALSFVQAELWAKGRAVPADDFVAYSYLTLPMLPNRTSEKKPPGHVNLLGNLNVTAGFVQSSARTWGLKEGLDVLQCRPARQNRLDIDTRINRIDLKPGATEGDRGDAEIRYHRAMDLYNPDLLSGLVDPRFLATLGKEDKGVPFPADRVRIRNDSIWFAANDWHWGTTPRDNVPKVHYRNPGRLGGLADLSRVVMLDLRARDNGHNRPGAAGAGTGLDNRNESGRYWTDTDVAHWLYASLHDEATGALWPDVAALVKGPEGTGTPANPWHSPLDILRLHPWADAAVRRGVFDASIPWRNVPFGWMWELAYSVNFPGMTGGTDWDDADADGKPLTGLDWVNANGDAIGGDRDGDGYQDRRDAAETDKSENMGHGRINLNTMPRWLLEEALPIKSPAIRQGVAQIIARYRDGTLADNTLRIPVSVTAPLAGTRAPGDCGVAYVAELLPVIREAAKAQGWDMNGDGAADAKDLTLDGILTAVGPLWQVSSPRSDYFCAHILVQGYDASDFTKGILESVRMMVILKRTSAGTVVVGAPFFY